MSAHPGLFFNQYKQKKVPRHFNISDHRGLHDVGIHVLDFIRNDTHKPETKSLHLRSELAWIQHLCTQIPMGMKTIDSDCLEILSESD